MNELWYRRMSVPAVISMFAGCAASFGLLIPQFAILSILGIAAGAIALHDTCRYEQLGSRLAYTGIITSVTFGLITLTAPAFFYWIEASSGHLRLDFRTVTTEASLKNYVGQKVCLKGYALLQTGE